VSTINARQFVLGVVLCLWSVNMALGADNRIVLDDCEKLTGAWNPQWIGKMAGGKLTLQHDKAFGGKGFVRWELKVFKADKSQGSIYHTVPFGDWQKITSLELAVRCGSGRHGDVWGEVFGSPARKHFKVLERGEATAGWKRLWWTSAMFSERT